MDAPQALAELLELSSQVERAVVIRADGSVLASTADDAETARLSRAALDLVLAAFEMHSTPQEVVRVDAELAEGGFFALREGGRTIAAVTGPQPTTGLVVYDLRTCLRRIDEDAKPKTRRVRKPKESE